MRNIKKVKIIYTVEVNKNWTEDDIEDYIYSLEWPRDTINMKWEEIKDKKKKWGKKKKKYSYILDTDRTLKPYCSKKSN